MTKSLGLGYAYPLSEAKVKEKVSKKPGNYAFGYYRKNSEGEMNFFVHYVGRSDTDLQTEILARMKDGDKKHLTHFKFSHAANTPLRAYKKECGNYHDFGGKDELINKIHPARPKGHSKKTLPCSKSSCKD